MDNERDQFVFGEFTLDPERRELRCAGRQVDIQNQTFDLLLFLVRHPQQVIDKDRLLEGAWGHVHLSDSAIAQAVRRARQAIGDDGRRQALIRTAHGRGIEFLPEVTTRRPPGDASETRRPGKASGLRPALILLLLFLVVAIGLLRLFDEDGAMTAYSSTVEAKRLLIESTQAGEGLGEQHAWLVETLPQTLDRLLRHSVSLEPLIAQDLVELGPLSPQRRAEALGADWILTTRADRREDRFVVEWTLTERASDRLAETGSLASPDAGLLLRQLIDQVHSAIAGQGPAVEAAHTELLSDPLAVELYARATRAIALEQRSEAAELLEAALTRQPNSALLQVALAKARFDPANQAGAALDHYEQLLDQIPDAQALARAWLAHELGTEYWFFGNTAAAETFLRKGLELLGDRPEPLLRGRTLNSLAFVLQSRNQFSQAWETALTAEQLLHGQDSDYYLSMAQTNLAYLAEDSGRLQQALDFHRQALELRRPLGVGELIAASEYGLARIERHLGQLESAATRLLANLALADIDNRPFDRFDNLEELAEIRWRQGRFDEAEELLSRADAIARAADDEIGLAWSEEVRGRMAIASGIVPRDLPDRLVAAIRRFADLGDEQESFTARLTHVLVLQTEGRTEESGDALAELGDHPALNNPVHRIRYQIALARQAQANGRITQTEELLSDAMERARQLGSVDQEALAALLLARTALERVDADALSRYLRIAQRWAPEDFRTLALQEDSAALLGAVTGIDR